MPSLRAAPEAAAPRLRQRWLILAGSLLILAGAGASGTFAYLWTEEAARADQLTRNLAETKGVLAATEQRLDATQERLSASNSLAERRRALLVQARAVLSRVDALFSSVDDIRVRAGAIQEANYTFSAHADELISTTVTLVNYLVSTDSAYVSYTYVDSLIDEANGELDTIRGDQYGFGERDSAYIAATEKFSTRADAFSLEVRKLQKQLKAAVDP
jgi:hypothetical protein